MTAAVLAAIDNIATAASELEATIDAVIAREQVAHVVTVAEFGGAS